MKKFFSYLLLSVIFLSSIWVSYQIMTYQSAASSTPSKVNRLGAIVRLTTEGRTFCSGTVISSHLILTAAHCVSTESSFGTVTTSNNLNIRADDNVDRGVLAKVVYVHAQTDHAILLGDFSLFGTLPLVTDPVALTAIRNKTSPMFVSCGYPLGGNLYCTDAWYVAPIQFYWAVDGVMLPGMSGGPTLYNGTVIATNFAVEGAIATVSPTYNVLESLRSKKGDK